MSTKTIVIFYLYGGHDGSNMLIPLDNYDSYASYRGDIAQSFDSLLPLDIGHNNLSIHGNFPRMAEMIKSGMAAPILGTGNLYEPTTAQQHSDKSVSLPPFLFSHSHQQSVNKGAYQQYSGWAGRVLDAWHENKTIPSPISCSITTHSDRTLMSAETMPASQILNEGETWQGVTGDKLTAIGRIASDASYDHLVERVASQILTDAVDGQTYLKDLFSQYPSSTNMTTGATIAAKLIAAAGQLGHERQIIHVAAPGGYDTHAEQFDTLNSKYQVLDNLYADFITELENYGVADQVVCITASDFGRSLKPNSRGTDHGWGSHHLLWGKPVNGGQAFGEFIGYDDPDYWTGAKRMIPKLSDTQSYATLARWFGLNESQIDSIFPELVNFSTRDLGFFS